MEKSSFREHTRNFDEAYRKGWRQSPTTHHRLLYRLKPFFRDHGVETILDVGCGRGLVFRHLVLDGFDVVGTEICPTLLARDLKGLSVLPYNIGGLGGFDDNEFDLVLMLDLLDHLRDEQEVDLAIGHANRLARVGIIVTLGGKSDMRCIHDTRDAWRGKLGNSIEFSTRTSTVNGDVVCFAYWRTE